MADWVQPAGRAVVDRNLTIISTSLEGARLKQVLAHEALHHKYPHKSEREIRLATGLFI